MSGPGLSGRVGAILSRVYLGAVFLFVFAPIVASSVGIVGSYVMIVAMTGRLWSSNGSLRDLFQKLFDFGPDSVCPGIA